MNIKFSIIIPAYNAEKYIMNALESIKNQIYKNLELIIVDDGSTDNTSSIINKFIDENKTMDIKTVRIENSGPAHARNIGLELASGDYFCFLDSDDFLDENTFEEIFEVNEEFDICFYGYNEIEENTSKLLKTYDEDFSYVNGIISGTEAAKLKLKRKLWICTGNAVYKLKLIKEKEVRNLKGINHGEDFNFIMKALINADKVMCIKKNYLNCTFRENSLMHSQFNNSNAQLLQAVEMLLSYLEETKLEDETKKELIDLVKAEYLNAQASLAKKIFENYKFMQAKKIYLENNYKQLANYNDIKHCLNKQKKIELYIFSHSLFLYYIATKLYTLKNK